MDAPANGLLTVVNGLLALLDGLLTPTALMLVLTAAGLAWIALVEVDELDRTGTKPQIGRGL